MATTDIFLIGGGGHAKVVFDCLTAQQLAVIGVFDPLYKGGLGLPALGEYHRSFNPSARAIVAIGDNTARKRIATAVAHTFTTAIHPSALVSPSAQIGEGSMVLHRTVVQAGAAIGRHVIINTGASVDHDCTIADFVHIAPGAVLCGGISIGEGAMVGAGAVIIPGVKVGAWATVGAGSVVIRDVEPGACVVGHPARKK